jgi:hypothetical protein
MQIGGWKKGLRFEKLNNWLVKRIEWWNLRVNNVEFLKEKKK